MRSVRRMVASKAAIAAAAVVLIGTGVVAVRAQNLPRSQAEFEQQIGLTAAQKEKLKKIDARYKPQLEAIDKKYRPQFEALQKQLQALQVKANAEVKPIMEKRGKEAQAVFTPAQMAKMKQIQAAMQQAQGGGMGMPTAAGK